MASQMEVTGAGHQSEVDGRDGGERVTIHEELLQSTYTFLGATNRTHQQLQILDEGTLPIPELDLKPEVDVLLSDPEVVEKLEQCLMNWNTQIAVVIEEQKSKEPQAPGPIAEMAFWQERASILSALSEQLKQPMVDKILEVMTKADTGIAQTLEGTVAQLERYRVESEENSHFLGTMERHFMVSCTFI
ncbi:dynein axonemal heavy chain 10-like [Scophthalmus maximus]|uniref:dynein axonemal heavy chain 10-like n=1 Tax=Scophthalmus maximus TaxID=52904 RepID=UPI001FA8225A|nr:dynein axonemal heavy chain 10-like [Scophthalmus maximus]